MVGIWEWMNKIFIYITLIKYVKVNTEVNVSIKPM